MTVAEFFEEAGKLNLKGPAMMHVRRWPGTSGSGTFELSMSNGENDLFASGQLGYHDVSLNFRLATVDDKPNAICQGRKMVIS